MREKGATIQQLLLGLALLAALCWNFAHAADIKALQLSAGATGTRAELTVPAGTDFKVISLANPDRLVVDLAGVELSRGVAMPAPAGLVKAVRSGHPVPGTTRIVFDLASPVTVIKPRFEDGPGGPRLVLEWPGDGPRDPIARIAATSQSGAKAAAADPIGSAPNATPAASPSTASPADAEPDPSTASAAATARLVASTVTAAPSNSAPSNTTPAGNVPASSMPSSSAPSNGQPSNGAPPTAGVPSPPLPAATLPPSSAAMPTVSAAPGTIATGVPTRIATGVPAPVIDSGTNTPTPRPRPMIGMRPLVVAIDPGHGGQDPGAIGLQGKREKDVTLAVGRELARQINATPGLKAYMTRDSDVFIPLPRRAQLARAAKADIFVSIHADAAENRSARGSSVYVLSLKGASSQRARWLADKENAADLIGGRVTTVDNTLASVLLDLTQSGHMKASEDAADHVLTGLRSVGSNHKPQIERANFAVLRTSDMPAMLVETAFISNPDEERRLTDPAAQRELARAILKGIDGYFQQQPPPGTMYASRAHQAAGSAGGGSP